MKTIGLASDHAGFELKQYVKQWLDARGWSYKDFGTYTAESCDYPDFATPWPWPSRRANATPASPSAAAAKASASP